MFDILHLVFLYGFLGGSIKFIDQAYDEGVGSIKAARILAILSGVAMGFLMAKDSPFSTAFYAAMLISLVMARKIDNRSEEPPAPWWPWHHWRPSIPRPR